MEDTKDTIQLTVLEFKLAYEEIQGLSQAKNLIINSTAGYWLGRLSEKLKPLFKSYNDSMNALIKSLGEVNEKTGLPGVSSTNKNWGKFNEEAEKLLSEKDKVEFKKIKFSLLQKEAGTENLPTSFWLNVGVHFVEEATD